jgi:hypothetical protein
MAALAKVPRAVYSQNMTSMALGEQNAKRPMPYSEILINMTASLLSS